MTEDKKKSSDDNRGSGNHRCNFCGKPASKVKRLFAGFEAFICSECILLCHDILETAPETGDDGEVFELPKPAEIKAFLDQYVIGQEEYKKRLSKLPKTWFRIRNISISCFPGGMKAKKKQCS